MEKMYMLSADQYESLNKQKQGQENAMSGSGVEKKTEADDVKIAKLHDQMIRKKDASEIETEKKWNELGARLKPILSTAQVQRDEILNQFPAKFHAQASFILNILSRLPKVSFKDTQLLIDGEPLSDTLFQIVTDIIRNDIKGVESVIRKLRTSEDDWDVPFDSFSDTLRGYLQKDGTLEELQSKNKSSFGTPLSSTPIKVETGPTTQSKRRKKQISPEASLGDVLQGPLKTNESSNSKKKKKKQKNQDGKGRQNQGKKWQWQSY